MPLLLTLSLSFEKEGMAIAGHCAFAPVHLLLLHVQVGEGGLGAYQVRLATAGHI